MTYDAMQEIEKMQKQQIEQLTAEAVMWRKVAEQRQELINRLKTEYKVVWGLATTAIVLVVILLSKTVA